MVTKVAVEKNGTTKQHNNKIYERKNYNYNSTNITLSSEIYNASILMTEAWTSLGMLHAPILKHRKAIFIVLVLMATIFLISSMKGVKIAITYSYTNISSVDEDTGNITMNSSTTIDLANSTINDMILPVTNIGIAHEDAENGTINNSTTSARVHSIHSILPRKNKNFTNLSSSKCYGKWEPRLEKNDDPGCPTAWPLPVSAFGCCSGAIGSIAYTHTSNSSSWCKKSQEQELHMRGASLLQGKRIFFIGDSVGQHWLNAMLLNAHTNNPNLFPSNASTWSEFFNVSDSYYEYDERGFCAFPFWALNMSTAWESAPMVESAFYPNLLCPPAYKKSLYRQCCPGGNPISATGAISARLNETKPDIVIVQLGVHFHTVPSFQTNMHGMVMVLGNYSALNPDSLVLFFESLPQHFDAPDGSYDGLMAAPTNRSMWTCPNLNSSQIQSDLSLPLGDSMSVGMHNFNRIAASVVEQTEGVQWLPTNSRSFDAMGGDAHKGATKCCGKHTDCTHYCYAPHLWQPTIDPFYFAVDSWFQSSD